MPTAFITGTAGFIGFHLARRLLAEGWTVAGYDGITPYYDVRLKHARHAALLQSPGFTATEAMLEDNAALSAAVASASPDVVIHLAAQAGVRYSLENPRAYVDANLTGTFNLLEAARAARVRHCLIASTSSVYGANTEMPFRETDHADMPMTLYAATKRGTEHMAHAQAHLWGLPVTALRFFTVYGPWGRPDMALFKFVSAALQREAIDVYNHGDMRRDFTHVDDLTRAIRLLIDAAPPPPGDDRPASVDGDSLSPVAPFRVVNIGNSAPVQLTDFISAIEDALGTPIRRNLLPMQPGDVPATWADCGLLERLTGYRPATDIRDGVAGFVAWYRAHYRV